MFPLGLSFRIFLQDFTLRFSFRIFHQDFPSGCSLRIPLQDFVSPIRLDPLELQFSSGMRGLAAASGLPSGCPFRMPARVSFRIHSRFQSGIPGRVSFRFSSRVILQSFLCLHRLDPLALQFSSGVRGLAVGWAQAHLHAVEQLTCAADGLGCTLETHGAPGARFTAEGLIGFGRGGRQSVQGCIWRQIQCSRCCWPLPPALWADWFLTMSPVASACPRPRVQSDCESSASLLLDHGCSRTVRAVPR